MDYFITDYKIDIPAGAEGAVLEDSIMHKGHPATAGSKILENFISPLDATVVTRLEASGIKILGKTKMDEFGIVGLFNGTSESVSGDCKAPSIPNTECRIPNSISSSGAVSAVADGAAAFALCNDYTGAIGQQAALCGLCYIHPTYGTVSRYGLIPAAVSMDQIGIVCKNPADGFRILSIIAGHDPKDGAMINSGQWSVVSGQGTGDSVQGTEERGSSGQGTGNREQETGDTGAYALSRPVTIGVPQNIISKIPGEASSVGFIGDFDTVYFDLQYFDVYAQVMRILCCAEISANISRYDGIKFGYRADGFADLNELYTKSRTEGFGPDAKLAAMIGAMVLSQENYSRYYDKAMRVRCLIRDSLEFDRYDVILLYAVDAAPEWKLELHALPRLCGLPAVTVPFGGSWITLVANVGCEGVLASALEVIGL